MITVNNTCVCIYLYIEWTSTLSVLTFSDEVCITFIGMIDMNLTGCRHLQIEYIWVSRHFLRIIIYSDIAAEQALDTGLNIIRSHVYTGHLYDAVLGLIIINSQACYFGLCSVVYVYACCGTYQLILNRLARIDAICMFKP